MVKELSEDARAEAASESSAVGSKDTVQFCVAGETKDQGGGRIDEVLAVVQRKLAVVYLLPDRIEDQIGGDLGAGPRDLKQKAILGERLFVVLFRYVFDH